MEEVREPSTGVMFPSSVTSPAMQEVQLLGAGLREKKIGFVGVKVYAVAFYAQSSVVEALAAFKGLSKGQLANHEQFFNALAESSSQKTVTICFVRDISGQQFANGLAENLEPRLKAKGVGKEVLQSFLDAFKGASFSSGARVYLGLESPESTHVTNVTASEGNKKVPEGAKTTTIKSPDLLLALNQVYLGKDSVSPSLKVSIAERLAADLLK